MAYRLKKYKKKARRKGFSKRYKKKGKAKNVFANRVGRRL